ncbi:WSC-domain-containing protein [Canariomyces notabilis]|uniref:WSC-domain-containing protein n=1 Tax=Canariomyces notabilis TaxID=2074819 RepID=A0AAN6TNH6_9PEZI|nr:WSC-domain-containing protein [Canariomyces arenarius]
MASISSRAGFRAAVSLACLVAAQAFPHQPYKRLDTSSARGGCFVDNVDGKRALPGASYSSDNSMTIGSCATFCSKFKYFGLEYGIECYCGDSFPTQPAADSDCSFPCSGDSTQTCGAGNRLNVYTNYLYVEPTPATLNVPYVGCFVDEGARALPDNLLGADDMTAQKCAEHCTGYSYFGVEYGRECWCGNKPAKTPAPESECSMRCAGDDSQLCGDKGRINVWGSPVQSPATVGEFQYVGCFTDDLDERSLTGKITYDSAMTLEACAAACDGYSYFGVEYGSQCYCGTDLRPTAQQVSQAECATRCGGDKSNVCGDADRLNVFISQSGKKTPVNLGIIGFSYKSCWTDDGSARSLTGDVLRNNNMTVESCAAFCQGYNYFGVEYASECYCGNELGGAAAHEEDCSQICSGNHGQWCGGSGRLNLYVSGTVTNAQPQTATSASPAQHSTFIA